jgi:hypothetical protein
MFTQSFVINNLGPSPLIKALGFEIYVPNSDIISFDKGKSINLKIKNVFVFPIIIFQRPA